MSQFNDIFDFIDAEEKRKRKSWWYRNSWWVILSLVFVGTIGIGYFLCKMIG